MTTPGEPPFRALLGEAMERGGFLTDDALAALLPLLRQVAAAHEAGLVAPLRGLSALKLDADGRLAVDLASFGPPAGDAARVERIQSSASRGVEIVGRFRQTTELGEGVTEARSLDVAAAGDEVTRPVFVTGYQSWEHLAGHHDAVTDVFSLGMLLASLTCGLDFDLTEDLESFAAGRRNLFAFNSTLHPVVARVVSEMTELNRHRRAQDLAEVVRRLENHRDIPAPVELGDLPAPARGAESDRRRAIQSRLRDRLFEVSRRNRLIYFKPTLGTLNLTLASVPIVLDYRAIRLEQLCVWHSGLADLVLGGEPVSLAKFLRFEDVPYIPSVLDKAIAEARRNRAEYGFARLRLVICFLRWHNLKEEPRERIHSPLLLLPVELTKKKGVRDNYVLEASSPEAEVNPALRHFLKDLYGLELPETVDLKETTVDAFHAQLAAQIQASEPGVVLRKVEKPEIQLIHQHARQRLDQWRRRQDAARQARRAGAIDYSYDAEDFRPLGLKLFLEKVRPSSAPLRQAAGDPAASARIPYAMPPPAASGKDGVRSVETERELFALRDGQGSNPYSWELDLASVTLGNFDYRKMTLVRDYANLLEGDHSSEGFDAVFSPAPRTVHETPPPLPLAEQYLVIPSDATQVSAVGRARSGQSYIVQGPPGTGKSQTITNLIADYAARGKRVLFVCEKRAAIDVVFHRLRRQGLDELCCLIHDSQADKRAFIQNLKQIYEGLLGQAEEGAAEADRARALRTIDDELAALERFSSAMSTPTESTGVPPRRLLHRLSELAELGAAPRTASPEEEEKLPCYALWLRHGEVARRLAAALADLGAEPCFAKHPFRHLRLDVLEAERPLAALRERLAGAEKLLASVRGALERSGLPAEEWRDRAVARRLVELAAGAAPLAEHGQLDLIDPRSGASRRLADAARTIEEKVDLLARARSKTGPWREKLAAGETDAAVAIARRVEGSFVKLLRPSYWRLKKTIEARYDFSKHAVRPTWTLVLEDLAAEHRAQEALDASRLEARRSFQADDFDALTRIVSHLRAAAKGDDPGVSAFARRISGSGADAEQLVKALAAVGADFRRLDAALSALLVGHDGLDFQALDAAVKGVSAEAGALPDLAPVLAELAAAPDELARALREVPLEPDAFEAASARRTFADLCRSDRELARADGPRLESRREKIERAHEKLLALNAAVVRARVRRKFLGHVRVSSASAAQLTEEEKQLKKTYSAGRRELEHELSKTMRYKSIRDLVAGNAGEVIRDLKPIWLMSPLSVSDTMPMDSAQFDVVIFDEASQVPVEEAVPALYRAPQVIVVGDEMQLPPTVFFTSRPQGDDAFLVEDEGERIEVGLDAESFLTQSARNLPRTLLSWHYRSRYEALISFSNSAFYGGELFTIPDRELPPPELPEIRVRSAEDAVANAEAALSRSISFHFMERSPYSDRRNAGEAAYIARLVREILKRGAKLSLGIVAFSEAQQEEIEGALDRLAGEDADFAARLEAEYVREEDDQFCGLFVKNLENVQGDERDVIILSICYGPDATGRTLMNFGPINNRGGEKRLNVIFSRAKRHMAVVTSIRHDAIRNDYNDGANALKGFLRYAEAVSKGDARGARGVLGALCAPVHEAAAPAPARDAVVAQIAAALRRRGHDVDEGVGQSRFRCDLAVRGRTGGRYELGVLVDTDEHYANRDVLERYHTRPWILGAFGWRVALVLTKDWLEDPDGVVARIERRLPRATAARE